MPKLRCWFCNRILEDLTLYICKQCIKSRNIKNLDDYFIVGKDRMYYEYWRDREREIKA